jgi:hypothetical protein
MSLRERGSDRPAGPRPMRMRGVSAETPRTWRQRHHDPSRRPRRRQIRALSWLDSRAKKFRLSRRVCCEHPFAYRTPGRLITARLPAFARWLALGDAAHGDGRTRDLSVRYVLAVMSGAGCPGESFVGSHCRSPTARVSRAPPLA